MGRLLVFIAGLLVVALFAALLAPMFIDWTDYRKDFEQQASLILGKKVVVAGTVSARLLPFPSITMNDVQVGADQNGAPLITVAHFSMDAELAPFLSGEAKIFDMRVDQPKAQIRLLKDGTLDWVRTGNPQIPAKNVILEHVTITGGHIDFIDEESGRSRVVSDLNADVSAKSLAGPWKIEGRAALDGQTGQFVFSTGAPDNVGELRLKARLEPDAQPLSIDLEGALKIVDLKPRYEGNFTAGDRAVGDAKTKADAKLAGPRVKGKFELTNESINIPEYRLETGSLSDPYVVTGLAKLDTGKNPEFALQAEGQQIDISHMGNDGETGKTSREANVSARIRLQAMLAVLADIPVPQVPGKAHVKLPAILAGDTTLRDVELDLKPNGKGWTIDRAQAELPGRTKIEASGELKLVDEQSFIGDLLVASTQPSGLAAWLSGVVDPALRSLKTAGFSAKVRLSPDIQQFEGLEIAMGPATLKGRIERQAADNAVPKLSVALDGDTVDYDALRALVSLFTGVQSQGALFEHDIGAQFSAKHFSAFGVNADDVQTLFTVSKGKLGLEELNIGSLAGAKISIQGVMQDGETLPTGSLDTLIYAEDPGPFLQVLQSKLGNHPALDRLVENASYFSGADLKLNLTTGGGSDWPVKLTLQGSANGSQINAAYSAETLGLAAESEYSADLTIQNPATGILLGQMGLQPLPFDGDSNGILTVNLAHTAGEPVATMLSLTADHTSVSVKGQGAIDAAHFLEGSYEVQMQAEDAEPYLLMAGIGLPQMGTGLKSQIAGKVTVTPEQVQISGLTGSFDTNAISGDLVVARTSTPLAVYGAVSLSSVDLPWLGEVVYGPLYSVQDGGFSAVGLAVSPIAGVNLDLEMKAQTFWPGVFGPFENVAGKLRYGSGALDLTDLSGTWRNGTVKGRLSASNNAGAGLLQGRLDIAGADTAAISWQKDGQPLVTGTFDLGIALESSGKSVAGLVDAASGSGTLTLKDTRVAGLNTSAFAGILAQADQMTGDVTPASVAPVVAPFVHVGAAELGTVVIPFTLAGGKLQAETVKAKGDLADFTADAKINLTDLSLMAHVRQNFETGENAETGAEAAVTLTYSGALDQPTEQLDVSEMANFLSLRMFERERRRVETLQANVLEKQRLRREVALFKWLDSERARMNTEMRMRKIQEDKLREAAQAEEAARQKALGLDPGTIPQQTPVTPGTVQQGQDLAPPGQ